jgi:phosphopantothenoylcysteine decarboxylase/phosphopantothenate--cysteine ligase
MSSAKSSGKKILFQLSGSIACYKACQVISRLVQAGHELEVVATRSALEFVGQATLEGLTGRPVHVDTFARGGTMAHIHLIRWADLIILAPATANTLNKMVAGVGDDLVTTLFLAHDFAKPYLIAPAMNTMMYRHPTTRASLKQLREWGLEILEAPAGALACGEVGEGRLMEPDTIVTAIESRLKQVASKNQLDCLTEDASPLSLRLLMTSGGTREPLDGVRAITNFSSGRTGAMLADYFRAQGHHVTFLHAQGSILPELKATSLRLRSFVTFSDLEQALKDELGTQNYDAVIHLAAVGDYSVEKIESTSGRVVRTNDSAQAPGKIDSDEGLLIRLKRNPKLVSQLRHQSRNPAIKVIAFKLTNTPSELERQTAVEKLAAHSPADWIVHNDLSQIDSRGDRHASTVFAAEQTTRAVSRVAEAQSKLELARALEKLLIASSASEKRSHIP